MGRLTVVAGVESSAFKQHGGRAGADLAVGPADDPAEADGVAGVGDDQVFRPEGALFAVQRGQRLTGPGAAHDDCGVTHAVEVEGVKRLVVLQHHEVGGVDHVADGPQPGPDEAVLQPLGRFADGHALDEAGGVTAAEVGVGDGNVHPLGDGRSAFAWGDLRLTDRAAGQGRDLVGHAQHRKAVQPIGG